MIKPTELSNVANEAVDQLQIARDYMAWLDSLAYAIGESIEKGHTTHAARLAGAAQYLSADYHNLLDGEVTTLNQRLTALELRA